jgi:hypothetical protein
MGGPYSLDFPVAEALTSTWWCFSSNLFLSALKTNENELDSTLTANLGEMVGQSACETQGARAQWGLGGWPAKPANLYESARPRCILRQTDTNIWAVFFKTAKLGILRVRAACEPGSFRYSLRFAFSSLCSLIWLKWVSLDSYIDDNPLSEEDTSQSVSNKRSGPWPARSWKRCFPRLVSPAAAGLRFPAVVQDGFLRRHTFSVEQQLCPQLQQQCSGVDATHTIVPTVFVMVVFMIFLACLFVRFAWRGCISSFSKHASRITFLLVHNAMIPLRILA